MAPESRICNGWRRQRWPGYISPRMFGRYLPFYEGVTERTLADHRDAEKHIHLAFGNF